MHYGVYDPHTFVDQSSYLEQHGIPGMKWGRRMAKRVAPVLKKGRTQRSNKKTSAKKKIKEMSDTELRNKINRLQMERQYSQLTAKKTSAGKKFVASVVTNAAQQTASKYVSAQMSKGADRIIKAAVEEWKKL